MGLNYDERMRKSSDCLGALLVLTLIIGPASGVPPDSSYRLLKKLILGGEGGWDYFDVEPGTGHVFIPRGSHILVLDAEGKQVADIPGVKGAHAIVFAPELKRAFLSTDGTVTILDLETMKVASEVSLNGKDPDAILYDASVKRVFTFNGGGSKDATAIDAESGKVLASVPLGGKPETAQADGAGHVYVNVEDKNRIVAFDAKTFKVLNTWPLSPCEEPAGMAIDVAHQRLFAGCHNQLMAVVDYTNGKVVTSIPIGKGIDANRFDPGTGFAFASCGDGTITVAHEDSPDKYTVVQTIQTQRGARTMALDAKNHNVYTVTAEFGPPPAPTPERPHPHPTVISKTFTLLIFGR
jgi:DNA-binding beta-propeller fold protein YncE